MREIYDEHCPPSCGNRQRVAAWVARHQDLINALGEAGFEAKDKIEAEAVCMNREGAVCPVRFTAGIVSVELNGADVPIPWSMPEGINERPDGLPVEPVDLVQ